MSTLSKALKTLYKQYGAEIIDDIRRSLPDITPAKIEQEARRVLGMEEAATTKPLARAAAPAKPLARAATPAKPRAKAAPPPLAARPTVNIGLKVEPDMSASGAREDLDPAAVRRALGGLGVGIRREQIRQSGTEPTLIAELDRALSPEEGFSVSELLRQKAIAQVDPEQGGALYGPQAAEWGVFDPEYFMGLDRRQQLAPEGVNPRIEARAGEIPKLSELTVDVSPRGAEAPADLSVFDMEGRPFITSMSDLSAAGDDITAVNDVALREPFSRRGGQDYMFDNPGAVWAADLGNARSHMALADKLRTETGQDPLFMPWAMGPRAVDFAHMPRELMLRYADAAMPAKGRQQLAREIRAIVPDFKSTDDPASIAAFNSVTGQARGALNRLLDQFRDRGGLGIGAARLASTDLDQLGLPLTSLRNVGSINPRMDLSVSTHPSYRSSVPGEGLGRLREPLGALDLLPDLKAATGTADTFGFPVGVVKGVKSPLRSLQMAPKGGVITEDMLRAIEDRLARAASEE